MTTAPSILPGCTDMQLPEDGHGFTHDVIVIGGGSGGLACAKRCKELGVNVAICDFVTPSVTLKTTWGIGGTCVNVGCIPKKLMHTAALHGEAMRHMAGSYGWNVTPEQIQQATWENLRTNVTMHIRSLNFGYNSELRQKDIKYYNARASFSTSNTNTLVLTDKTGATTEVSARRIILAMGGRPALPTDCPGAQEFGITSDDIFKLQREPGKTLVIGASYVALECAGMLRGIGREVTVMMRSIPLRGYDQDMAEKVVTFMESISGVRFIRRAVPVQLERGTQSPTSVLAKWKCDDGSTGAEEFDTVLFAIGRQPDTRTINLPVALNPKTGKVIVNQYDRTTVPHVYAIGDIVDGGLELTPVAIKQGRYLADRLFGPNSDLMTYEDIATTVFTPLEYGCVGLSEEAATEKYGDVVVYHSEFTPLEWTVPHLPPNMCYMKLVCVGPEEKVVGFHVLSPNAGEITQGVAVALKVGATKKHFDETVGIHPTIAEEMTTLRVTKGSGLSAGKSGC